MFALVAVLAAPMPLVSQELPVLERYTSIWTIAGTSLLEDGNYWLPGFEGASPLQVELSNPHDAGTDAFGRVYIVDKESHSILRVDSDGSRLITVAGTHSSGNGVDTQTEAVDIALDGPNGLHVFLDGSFLILDTSNSKVRWVSREGISTTVFTYPAGFGWGRGLVANSDGTAIYFCGETNDGLHQNVKKWTPEGISTLASLPVYGRGLGNLDLHPDGSLLVTSVGDHRVYQLAEGSPPRVVAGNGLGDGNLTTGSLATDVSLNRVRGIAALPDGTFFLATQKGGDIWWVDNGPENDGIDRRIHLFLHGSPSGNDISPDFSARNEAVDHISEPRSIQLASNGDLLVTSNDKGVIRAIRTTFRPQVPSLTPERSQISWSGQPHQTVWLEQSENLLPGSWTPLKITRPRIGEFHHFPRPEEPGQSFFRLQTPQSAGRIE